MEVDVKFEPSGQVGIVAAGSYLIDAAHRMGIEIDALCERRGECDSCEVTVIKGKDLLSGVTNSEKKHLTQSQINQGSRLSCQAKIEKQGELVVMVKEKVQTEEEKEAEQKRKARREFEELPLEKKVANLLELEMITLSDTFSFILNSPYKIVGKVMDVLAEFGLKMDDESKKSKRPAEHANENGAEKKDKDKKETENKSAADLKEKATESEKKTP